MPEVEEYAIQYCIKTERAYSKLKEIDEPIVVNYEEFNEKYGATICKSSFSNYVT